MLFLLRNPLDFSMGYIQEDFTGFWIIASIYNTSIAETKALYGEGWEDLDRLMSQIYEKLRKEHNYV